MEWAGGDQDTFRLLLAAWTNLGGDNPSGAEKEREREEKEERYIYMSLLMMATLSKKTTTLRLEVYVSEVSEGQKGGKKSRRKSTTINEKYCSQRMCQSAT